MNGLIEFLVGLSLGGLITYIIMMNKNKKVDKELSEVKFEFARVSEEKKNIEKLEEKFSVSFENLANNILEKKVESMSKFTEKELGHLIKPLEKDIKEFKEKVDTTHKESIEKNASLVEKISNLEKVSNSMSDEANKLTKALKGDSKIQGDWGEVILERLLETSGLRKNEEYFTQGVGIDVRDDDGTKLKPDFIIRLPEDKNIIVDSKVSLKSYQEYINEENEASRDAIAKNLLQSFKNHINGLSDKHYDRKANIETPDFVFMFVPIENIFNTAYNLDPEILKYAWDRKIAIVTPVNLMYLLWVISYMWKQNNQAKNVQAIAAKSGAMYDKFKVFLDQLMDIGKNLDKAKESYDKAFRGLSTGPGNLIKRSNEIKELGADTKKEIKIETTE